MNSPKKRILFILPELTSPGGMEIENLGFISAIQNNPKLEVIVLNFYYNPKYFSNLGFVPLRLNRFDLAKLFFSIRFLKILLKSRCKIDQSVANLSINFPDIIVGFLARAVDASELCFAGVRPGNLLHFIHDLTVKYKKKFIYHEISKFNPKHQAFFQKVNSYGTFLISGIEKKEDLLNIFPNARVREVKQWLYDGQEEFLEISPPDPQRIVFGTISRLDFGKNFEVIFQALAILKSLGEQPSYILIGDGPELVKLKQLATSLGIKDLIDFRGAITFEDRRAVYADFDVFLMCSIVEGGPVTILEAMAAGRPIISTNVGDVRNRIESGITGFILDTATDPIVLAEKMKVYLSHPDLIIRHGKSAKIKFFQEFDQNKGKDTFLNAIIHELQS